MRGQPQPDFEGRSVSVLSKELKTKIPDYQFYLSVEALEEKGLSAKAKKTLSSMPSPKARHAWLLGRKALSDLAIDQSLDVEKTLFFKVPHKNISLTHKPDLALAVYRDDSQLGVGIDFEPSRKIPVGGMQHFLTEGERRFVESPACKDSNFLALWTVKEALYKALPDNANRLLLDIEIEDLNSYSGTAVVPDRPAWKLQYECVPFLSGFLSVATCWPA